MKKHSREGVITHKFVEMMTLMNVYLNHFPKHEKQALCAQIRNTAYGLFNLITEGYKRRGVNFVGYRTWASHRLIRKYSWRKFRRAVASGKDEVAWSIIAHAQHTASMDAMGACIRQNAAMYQRLPEAHKRRLAA